jgi:hypothetical protein
MLGKLVFFDKASISEKTFYQSIVIVFKSKKIISRFNFVKEMQIFIEGSTSLPKDEPNNYIEGNRSYFNKSKAPRIFGFIDIITVQNKDYLVLTKRGSMLYSLLNFDSEGKPFVPKENRDHLRSLFIDSLVFQTFGKNNSGLETSNSDIEPIKIIIKSLIELKKISSVESVFLVYGLQNKHFENYSESINELKKLKTNSNNDEIIYNKLLKDTLIRWSLTDESLKKATIKNLNNKNEKPYPLINIVSDNKLLGSLKLFEIISSPDENGYYFIDIDVFYKNKDKLMILSPYSKPLQIMIIGSIGSGKSFFIENNIIGHIYNENQIIRTSLSEDYSYSDFIGTNFPTFINNTISITFKPGPFSIALLRALKEPHKSFYLIIEEINSANVSSVFGDISQLFERNNDHQAKNTGESIYFYNDIHLSNYLKKNHIETNGRIFLPANLNIITSMTTSRNSINMVDETFRRKFQIFYHPINFDSKYVKELDELSRSIFKKNTWSDFAKMINSIIDNYKHKIPNSFYEEKYLGPYFVSKSDLINKENFCNKVIYYIYHDILKYISKKNLNYDELYKRFAIENDDIYSYFYELEL